MTDTTVTPGDDVATARGTRLATVGLLMAATGPLLLLAATLLWGLDTDEIGFLVVATVAALAGAWLVNRPRTAAKVAGIVLAVLVAGALFWTAFGLAEPTSFFDFVPGLLVVPGVLLALIAGITSIRARKRGRPLGGGERRAAVAVLGVVLLLAGLSGALTLTSRDTVDADDAARADLTVELQDFEFTRAGYDVGGDTTVLVKNSDPFAHNFTVDALDIDVDLGPGSEKLVTIPARPGTYVLYCDPHTEDPEDPSADDMAAEITVD